MIYHYDEDLPLGLILKKYPSSAGAYKSISAASKLSECTLNFILNYVSSLEQNNGRKFSSIEDPKLANFFVGKFLLSPLF